MWFPLRFPRFQLVCVYTTSVSNNNAVSLSPKHFAFGHFRFRPFFVIALAEWEIHRYKSTNALHYLLVVNNWITNYSLADVSVVVECVPVRANPLVFRWLESSLAVDYYFAQQRAFGQIDVNALLLFCVQRQWLKCLERSGPRKLHWHAEYQYL